MTQAAPTLGEVADLAADLTGIHPVFDQAVTLLASLATTDLTDDQAATVLSATAGSGPSLLDLIAVLAQHLTAHQPEARALADQFAHYLTAWAPTGLIDDATAHLTY